MDYVAQVWVDHQTPLDAEHLNHMEAGIASRLSKSGHEANKFLGTDSNGNVVVKEGFTDQTLSLSWDGVTDKPTAFPAEPHQHSVDEITGLSAVAKSGSYQDLTDKPESIGGKDGADGFSPTITVAEIAGGHQLTITNQTGVQTINVMDGENSETFYVSVAQVGDTVVADKTLAEIETAIGAKKNVVCAVSSPEGDFMLPLVGHFANTAVVFGLFLGGSTMGVYITAAAAEVLSESMTVAPLTFTGAVSKIYDGSSAETINIPKIPAALKNPYQLQFTGAVEALYDGSKTVTVNIPIVSGEAGGDGADGQDGYSPTIDVATIAGGHRLTVTDVNGTEIFDVMNGVDGAKGDKGDKGDAGARGETGAQGEPGAKGDQGAKGDKGDKGETGKDGYTPIKGTDYWTAEDQQGIIDGVTGELSVVIAKEVAKKSQLTPKFANNVNECTDTDLVYVLPDGYIYAYMQKVSGIPEITIEAQAGGYWYADEWNSTGAWKTNSGCSAKRTNIFAVTPGDQLSYKGSGTATVQSVAWLDAEQKYISEEYYTATGTSVTITAPSNAAYAWCESFAYTSTASNVVLSVEWIKCQSSTISEQWANTGIAFVAEGSQSVSDVLNGRKIVYDGDSIAESRANNGGGYAQIIAEATGSTFENQAVGGARLCSNSERHSVVDNLANLPADGDLYCFEGGINDFWGNTPIGECSETDYTGELDTSTIFGALETIFRHCLDTFVGKPVCFVIVHKVQNTGWTMNANGDTFRDYHDAMIKVCEKYSIPYYDAFLESGLNGWHTAQSNAYLTANGAGTADGIHPNAEGYKRYYVPQLMALFRRCLPVI